MLAAYQFFIHGMSQYKPGDQVFVFCRYCPWRSGEKFMVARTYVAGTQAPRIARSDGWVPATVVDVAERNPLHELSAAAGVPAAQDAQSTSWWVRVRYNDRIWVDSKGQVLEESSLFQWVSESSGDLCMQAPIVDLSVLCVRWGGTAPVDDRRFDFAVSDKLIHECMQAVLGRHSRRVEVHTVHVTSSADLDRINEHWALSTMSASAVKVGMYFLWGCNNDSKPGYVLSQHLLGLMERMESVGIVTRYPNHSQLYRAITSKEYQAVLCTSPKLAVPPTIAVPSSLLLANAERTCEKTLESLTSMKRFLGITGGSSLGVVKVGNEWMGDGVRAFSGSSDLREKAISMLNGAHGRPAVLLVQDRIRHVVCEPRVFVYNGTVKGIRYTWNEKHNPETGRIHALRTCSQRWAAKERFEGDSAAQQYVEKRIAELVKEWNMWLIAAGGEVPVFVRMDFLVERISDELTESEDSSMSTNENTAEEGWTFPDDGDEAETNNASSDSVLPTSPMTAADEAYAKKFRVWTCELGEIGSSMVGFREGRDMLWESIADSCAPPAPVKKPSRPPPRLPPKP